jgi:hypothetical protein
MPNRDALAGLNQALAAIDVMIRNGKAHGGRLGELAREARQNAERIAKRASSAHASGGCLGISVAEKV